MISNNSKVLLGQLVENKNKHLIYKCVMCRVPIVLEVVNKIAISKFCNKNPKAEK